MVKYEIKLGSVNTWVIYLVQPFGDATLIVYVIPATVASKPVKTAVAFVLLVATTGNTAVLPGPDITVKV